MNKPSDDISNNVAIIQEWLVTFGGSEQILAALLETWQEAKVFTQVYDPEGPCSAITTGREIETTFIQNLPGAKRNHRRYLPLMPLAVEQFDVRCYDVVISISHAVAHGVITQPDQLHINYVCAPMRYAWHLYHEYLEESGLSRGLRGSAARILLHYLRMWDANTSKRVDNYVAISHWMAKNVWRVYRRRSSVIYPPVNVHDFELVENKENYYVTITRLVPYKRVDLILEAFRQMPEKKLVIVGDGPDRKKLESTATSNVEFLGYLPFAELKTILGKAKAFLYTAVEDFGIVPVEAQACGTPVIAYGKGGVLETVIDGETGILYADQTSESLIQAVEQFENGEMRVDRKVLRENAWRFRKERFQGEFRNYVDKRWTLFTQEMHSFLNIEGDSSD